jgi:hypothetical protein
MTSLSLEAWQAAIVEQIGAYTGEAPIPGDTAIEVYTRNSIGARAKALESRCTVLREVLGNRYFAMLASRYVAQHLSRNPDLNLYGDSFPDWLQSQLHCRAELSQLAYLPDLAALECAWSRALWVGIPTAGASACRPDGLYPMRVAPVGLRINPTLTLIVSDYAIDDLWGSHRKGDPAMEVVMLPQPRHLAVLRPPQDVPRIDRIEASTANVLNALIQCVDDDPVRNNMTDRDSSELLGECVDRCYLIDAVS